MSIFSTLWSLIDGGGVGIVGGLEKISKINCQWGWNNRGVGKNLSDSHFPYIVTVRL